MKPSLYTRSALAVPDKIYQSPGGVCRLVEIAVGKHTAPHRPATRVAANTSMRRVVITHGRVCELAVANERGFGRERIVLEMERTRYRVLDPTGSSHRRHRPSPLPCSTNLPIYLRFLRLQSSSQLTHARTHASSWRSRARHRCPTLGPCPVAYPAQHCWLSLHRQSSVMGVLTPRTHAGIIIFH